MPINRTPILKTNWLGQSPYLIKRIVEPYTGKFKQKKPKQVVSEVPQEDQEWDLGTLPEVVITPEVVRESPIIAQETPTAAVEDPYQVSDEPYQESDILKHYTVDDGQLTLHVSSPQDIKTAIIQGKSFPITEKVRNSPLEIKETIKETPVELNISKKPYVRKVYTESLIKDILAQNSDFQLPQDTYVRSWKRF